MSALLNFAHPTLEPERALTVAQEAIALASTTLLGPPKPEDLEPLTFKEFVRQAWHILEPSTELSWNWSIDAIIEHLVAVTEGDIQKLVINVPPGSMKSLLTAVLWPMWTWGEVDPASRWLFSSYEATLTIRDSLKCRRLIRSEWYQRRYGHVFQILKEEDNKRKFENNKTGFRQCLTPRGGGTGNRAGYIVCLPYNGLISTDVGLLKIGEIVENRLSPMVKGFDHETGKEVWTKILSHQKNPSRPFTKIKTKSHKIELTDDHEIYVLGKGYICAASVEVGDLVIKENASKTKVTELQRVRQRIFVSEQCSVLRLPVLQRQQESRSHHNLSILRDSLLPKSRAHEEVSRSILLQTMSRYGQSRGEKPAISYRENSGQLLSLQSDFPGKSGESRRPESLLQKMFWNPLEDKSAGKSNLSILPRTFSCDEITLSSVLFSVMREQRAFLQDDWGREQQLFSWGINRKEGTQPIPRSYWSAFDKRWGDLPSLRDGGSRARVSTTFSSHQLRKRRRQDGEYDYALPLLPRENAWEDSSDILGVEIVCSVERSPRVEPYTYNIETETHNYFAQGLLVHNCDDPHKVTEALSEKKRQFTLDWWNTEMSNRGTDKHARFVVIMQRVHEFDVAGNCIEMGYDLLRIPQEFEPLNAIVTGIGWKDPRVEDKELMWPDRFDAKFIESQQDQLGAYGYSGQHQQRPTPAEGGIIRREYLEDRYDMEVIPKYDAVLVSADTAERPGVDNAYSVFIVLGVSRDKYYVLDVYRKKVDQPTLKEDFYNLCIKWKPNIALVEDKSSGVGLIQYGQKETRINIIPIKPDRDKISRLINESPSFKAQKVVLPKTGQAPWLFDVVDELTSAPNGEYMDICDSFSQALRYLREEWQPMTGAAMLRSKKKG